MTSTIDSVSEDGTVVSAADSIVSKSPRELAWARLSRDKFARVALGVIVFYLFVAAFAPVICAVLGISPYALDGDALNDYGLPKGAFGGISTEHWLGVEPGTGRDIFARLIYGARASLLVGILATFLTTAIGLVIGMVAGYKRGWADSIIGRFMDITLAFPSFLLIIALTRPFTQRLESLGVPEGNPARMTYIILVLATFGWVYVARVVRGQTLSLREREFVEAAKASGATNRHIIFKQLLPNLWAPVIVIVSLSLPGYVATESTLSFLGLGLMQPAASWGVMLGDSVRYYRADPTYLFIPGIALVVLVMAFNIVGDAVRDALDPKADRQNLL
jgi:peptide/nickel transport system permease protein